MKSPQWITNAHRDRVPEYRRTNKYSLFEGLPRGTSERDPFQLEKAGMVGLYTYDSIERESDADNERP